jgi:hypothetical protein
VIASEGIKTLQRIRTHACILFIKWSNCRQYSTEVCEYKHNVCCYKNICMQTDINGIVNATCYVEEFAMLRNLFLSLYVSLFVCLGLYSSDREAMKKRGTMMVTITNNTLVPSIDITLKDKISQVDITAQRNNFQESTFQVKVDSETLRTQHIDDLKRYDINLLPNFNEALKQMTLGQLANNIGAYHITPTDNNPDSTYEILQRVFKQLLSYHWTVTPDTLTVLPRQTGKPFEFKEPTLRLEYFKGTTALDLKNKIHEKMLEKATDNKIIKNRMYNIMLNKNGIALRDDFPMPDIDYDKEVKNSQDVFSLKLYNTIFSPLYREEENKLIFSVMHPPLSIDKKSLLASFGMTLEKIDKTDIKIKVDADSEDQPTTTISDEGFSKQFDDYIKTDLAAKESLNRNLNFFKLALTQWANKVGKEVVFQGGQLTRSPLNMIKQPTSATATGTPKKASWFFLDWLQQLLTTRSSSTAPLMTWTIPQPTTFNMDTQNVNLTYPEKTSVSQLKRIIRTTLKNRNLPDYDIFIMKNGNELQENDIMPNVDQLSKSSLADTFVLKLVKKRVSELNKSWGSWFRQKSAYLFAGALGALAGFGLLQKSQYMPKMPNVPQNWSTGWGSKVGIQVPQKPPVPNPIQQN